jgi:hypothetical protein
MEARSLLAPPTGYREWTDIQRLHDEIAVASVRCAEHPASMIHVVHPLEAKPDTPWFGGYDEPGPPLDLERVREMVARLAARIDAPDGALPTFGVSRDFGYPHIEVNTAYHWVIVERGREVTRRTTASLDELLFWTFEWVTQTTATPFAVAHRRPARDYRRALFEEQLRLLARLRPDWAARQRAELAAILADAPFMDDGPPF